MVMSLAGSIQAQKGPLSEELVCALADIDRGVNGQSNLVLWDATLWEWTPGIRGHSHVLAYRQVGMKAEGERCDSSAASAVVRDGGT